MGLHLTTGPAPLPCGFLGLVFRVGDEGVLGSTRALSLCEESQVGSGERWVGWVGFRVAMGVLDRLASRTPYPMKAEQDPWFCNHSRSQTEETQPGTSRGRSQVRQRGRQAGV